MTYAQEQAAKTLAEIWPEYRARTRSTNPADHRKARAIRDELWRCGRREDWSMLTNYSMHQGA